MREACLLMILAWNSREDFYTRVIPLKINLLFCLLGTIWTVMTDRTIVSVAAGMAVGAGLLAISFLTGEAVGSGDALLLFVTGSFLGGCKNILLLLTAWTISGIWSGVLLIARKAGRKNRIPFAPFLLAAYMLGILPGW